MLMYVIGAWFLINLMVAVLGAAFEREQAEQKKRKEIERRERASQKWKRRAGGTQTEQAPASNVQRALLDLRAWLSALAGITAHNDDSEQDGQVNASVDDCGAGSAAGSLCLLDGVATMSKRTVDAAMVSGTTSGQERPGRLPHGLGAGATSGGTIPEEQLQQRLHKLIHSFGFRCAIVTLILASTIVVALDGPYVDERFGMGQRKATLRAFEHLFGTLFLLEMTLKLYVLGGRRYFASPLNIFDALVVSFWLLELILMAAGIAVGLLDVFKVFRLIRVFKLAHSVPSLQSFMSKVRCCTSISILQTTYGHNTLYPFAHGE